MQPKNQHLLIWKRRDMQKLSMEALNRKSVEEFRQAAKSPIVVVLENIRSAYNVGSIFRTADAFLLEAVFLTGYTAHPPHKEIKKTALGAEESVLWKHFSTTKEAIQELRSCGYTVFAVEQTNQRVMLENVEWDTEKKIALVLGNEVSGVEQETIDNCDGCIEIPQLGMKHSLNMATAGGVVLWEFVRKWILTVKHNRR